MLRAHTTLNHASDEGELQPPPVAPQPTDNVSASLDATTRRRGSISSLFK
jgi:hypothetical protein